MGATPLCATYKIPPPGWQLGASYQTPSAQMQKERLGRRWARRVEGQEAREGVKSSGPRTGGEGELGGTGKSGVYGQHLTKDFLRVASSGDES